MKPASKTIYKKKWRREIVGYSSWGGLINCHEFILACGHYIIIGDIEHPGRLKYAHCWKCVEEAYNETNNSAQG
jgi:hypothetical protein